MGAPPSRSIRASVWSALVCGLALGMAASGCRSTPGSVASWMWPPPLGVAMLRGTVANDDPSRPADPRVVYLIPEETVAPLPSLDGVAVVRWRDGAFEPRSVAVHLGARVRIVNDGVLHHRLFTAGDRPIQIDLPAHGEYELHWGATGPSHIYCSLHPSEYLLVYASQQRYLGTVAPNGSWAIGPVAPGDYHLMLWSPSAEGLVRRVRVWPWTVQHLSLQPKPGPQ